MSSKVTAFIQVLVAKKNNISVKPETLKCTATISQIIYENTETSKLNIMGDFVKYFQNTTNIRLQILKLIKN